MRVIIIVRKILFIVLAILSFSGFGQKAEYNFSTPADTTQNYYVVVYPKEKIKGSILLLPGFGELPKTTLTECNIQNHAAAAGYLTIIPALGDWSFFYIDESSHKRLNKFVEEIFSRYALEGKPFFIGGHSFGGTMALQYAQRAYSHNSTLRKPAAAFAIDPPLDIERLYNCMTTANRPTKNPISIQEDNYISSRIQQEFKASPKTNPEKFWSVSPYAQSDPNHSSLATLLTLPIRIYNEPDINWYIANRSIDYYCINAIDSSAMINWLTSLGNKKAELILTSGKGYRVKNKVRHPHSWSIADGQELIKWLNENSQP